MKKILTYTLFWLLMSCQSNGQSKVVNKLAGITDQNDYPIILHEGMLASITGRGESARLVDAQTMVVEPGEIIAGGAPWDAQHIENGLNRSFIGGFNDGNIYQDAYLYYPLEVVIDLETERALSRFCWTDLNGDGVMNISYQNNDKKWISLTEKKLDMSFRWDCFENFNGKIRFLKLTFDSPNAHVGEIRLYEKIPVSANAAQQRQASKRPYPIFKDFFGTNINTEDPAYQLSLFEFAREYHDWHLEAGDNDPKDCNVYGFNPSNGFAGWKFDQLYDEWNDAGTTIAANLKGTIPALQQYHREDKPIEKNSDPTDPQSYAAHAEYLYQFAARYGQTSLDDSKIAPRLQERPKSGLNKVAYIEDWNEQDKYWIGGSKTPSQRMAYFHPYEYAAMLSADYDGHENTVFFQTKGTDCNDRFPTGIKNADPNMKVVMSGITGLNLDYVKGIYTWSKLNRKDGKFPADVLNFHHYSNNFGGQAGGPTKDAVGVSPEADRLYERLKKVINYRDEYLPEMEVWISEFGYDVHPESPQRAPAIGRFSADEVQAQWLVRSYLAMAAAGVDKAQMFMLTDHYLGNPAAMFSTSGVLKLAETQNPHTPFPEFDMRTSFFYLYGMKNVLRDYRFEKIIDSKNKKINVYQFSHATDSDKKVYAVWANTSEDFNAKNVNIPIDGEVNDAYLIELTDQDIDGKRQDLFIKHGQVTIPSVTESPAFLIINDPKPNFEDCAWNIPISKEMVSLDGDCQWGDPTMLIDEPFQENTSIVRQPICGKGGTPINAWMGFPGESFDKNTEAIAVIDLQKKQSIKGISIFDAEGQGWLRIEHGEPGKWQVLDRYRTTKYLEWRSWFNLDLESRFLRIVLEESGAVIGEIVVF